MDGKEIVICKLPDDTPANCEHRQTINPLWKEIFICHYRNLCEYQRGSELHCYECFGDKSESIINKQVVTIKEGV